MYVFVEYGKFKHGEFKYISKVPNLLQVDPVIFAVGVGALGDPADSCHVLSGIGGNGG